MEICVLSGNIIMYFRINNKLIFVFIKKYKWEKMYWEGNDNISEIKHVSVGMILTF